jgi:hypothetical protein
MSLPELAAVEAEERGGWKENSLSNLQKAMPTQLEEIASKTQALLVKPHLSQGAGIDRSVQVTRWQGRSCEKHREVQIGGCEGVRCTREMKVPRPRTEQDSSSTQCSTSRRLLKQANPQT